MAIDESLFDSRVVERNIQKGLITREDYATYLASLGDVESNATPMEAKFEAGVLAHDADDDLYDDEDEDEGEDE